MTRSLLLAAVSAAAVTLMASAASAGVTDTVQSPTGFFVPTDAQKYDSPYYRGNGQGWGWTHTAIGGTITTAALNISAFDVDASSGENDLIEVLDSGTWTAVGSLAGGNDIWAFSNFVLGANFFDDIATGLQVRMTIDTNDAGWFVTLGKSSLSIDGGGLPPPQPGVPEPATWALMLLGFGAVGSAIRSRRRAIA